MPRNDPKAAVSRRLFCACRVTLDTPINQASRLMPDISLI
ncbi:unnamed protein product [Ciceribacter sp. T2.26MG-112.2]|nr:unnamed protein product [Ciceribacter naphthalenivorans]